MWVPLILKRAYSLLFTIHAQHWNDHFRLNEAEIQPLTPEARVTVKILQLNDEQRLKERKALLDLGLYP